MLTELGTLRGESIQGQLDGTIPSTTNGQSAEPDKLVNAVSVDMSALGGMGGGFGGGHGGGFDGGMPNMPDGFDMDTLRQAMEIIGTAMNEALTEEQRTQLHELGLSDDQIDQLLTMPVGRGGFGGGVPARNGE